MNTLLASPKYRKFTRDRNQALEQINLNTQLDVSRMLFDVLDGITGFVSHMGIQNHLTINHMQFLNDQLRNFMLRKFTELLPKVIHRIQKSRKAAYTLTYFAELEAIARATQKTNIPHHSFKVRVQDQMNASTVGGQDLTKQVWHSFAKLQSKIESAFKLSLVQELTPLEVVTAVKKSYPQVSTFKRPPRALKPIRESDRPKDDDADDKEFTFYHDLTNDADWDQAVQAYKDTELPPSRFDQSAQYDPEVGHMRYSWELEQDMTDDFVQSVRDGQVQAANDLGVKEFVWVAIIDNKTCDECCLPRNGKTTSEIEQMDDDCDATVPPAHPNCRCDIAPVSSTDEVEGPNWKDFGDWLES